MRTLQPKAPETIRAYVRIKPLLNDETSVLSNTEHQVFAPKFTQDTYSFNEVFGEHCRNDYIFNKTMKPIVQHIFEGYNACVLAYGQTSTGKTYTMKGVESDRGLIPRTIRQIFTRMDKEKMVAKVRISYFEIYNQNIIDLLSTDNPPRYLDIRDDARKNAIIMDMMELEVQNQQDSLDFYDRGETRRKFASNNINFLSSRSHTIFRISLEVAHEDVSTSTSVIDMVDLAGSESISKTNAVGLLKKESENINRSLLALSNVIRSLSELYDKDRRVDSFEGRYINFRDSRLTRILQPCLTGNSKTIVICTIQQLEQCVGQTINTLKFGVAANSIKINATKNIRVNPAASDPKYEQLIQTLQQERAMRQQLQNELIQVKNSYESENTTLKNKINDLAHQLVLQQTQNINSGILINQLKGEKHAQNEHNGDTLVQLEDSLKFYKAEFARIQRSNEEIKIRYDNLKKHNQLLQKNQRTLIDKLAKYQRELLALNENAARNNEREQDSRVILSSKQNTVRSERENSNAYLNGEKEPKLKTGEVVKYRENPYTISRIIELSSRILDMKIQIEQYTKSNVQLQQQNEKLLAKIELLQNSRKEENDFMQKNKQSRASGNSKGQRNSGSRMGEWEIRNMKDQNKKLRAEKAIMKKKLVQMRNTLKTSASSHIEELHGFNRFVDKNFSEKEKEYFQFLFDQSPHEFAPIPLYQQPTIPEEESQR